MTETLQFDLVTPAALIVSEAVEMVEVPGAEGDFGVLANHSPFMSIIRPGVITVHSGAAARKRYFITAGYAEVNPQGCTVLAESIRDMAQVSKERAQKERDDAARDVDYAKDDFSRERAAHKLVLAEALLAAAA